VEMSPHQLEWLKRESLAYLKRYVGAFALMLLGIFLVLLDPSLKIVAILVFAVAFLKVLI
jgi:hypothetical protein